MTFKGRELVAIVKMAMAIATADERFVDEEKAAILLELIRFGVTKSQIESLMIKVRDMPASESLLVIAAMDDEQKKYVTGYLASIIVVDGEVDDSEVKMWQLISELADLPYMTIAEAVKFWQNH